MGLTLAKIQKIDGNKICVTGTDLLNGTPILDIKPYVPEYDSHPVSATGWLETEELDTWTITWDQQAMSDLALMGNSQHLFQNRNGPDDHRPLLQHFADLERFEDLVERQLRHRPFDKHRHRIKWNDETNLGTLSLGPWRVEFAFSRMKKEFQILHVKMG